MAGKTGFRKNPSKLLRVGEGFQLSAQDTDAAPGFDGRKRDSATVLALRAQTLAELQEKLFAQAKFGGTASVLLVLQAMDTAGKGGVISHVVGSVDPQGVQLKAFKAPTKAERSHDFLWRVRREAPRPGMLGVFDRSHYEDVLIQRVHATAPTEELDGRYDAINAFEAELAAQGTKVVKVMLNISPDTQKQRLLARLDNPAKHWKYASSDLVERACWPEYMEAYQVALERTSTEAAPWYVVPADKKWYARLAVQEILIQALEGMGLHWPAGDFDPAEECRKLAAT
ncbi:polyphosphate kinase 2 family protein [Paenarthrobacter sp. Z7-10]|uniref:polyphosphate kinase 2 family protein n=1 Tax=Paenarthrobacter sp. Z7-10 TaxID=2787635 RepID=UPI0022A8D6EC|nr:polyphosphate kinase 2 family protein [Paenarthrobacter sp. Z7-10]MCZ2403279.1 polyphosphate kinase 2 family protein [Paenarthrobacter sp. Z7-10]